MATAAMSAVFQQFDPAAAAAAPTSPSPAAVAIRLFEDGKYAESLAAWTRLTEATPSEGLYWSNRGTVELILGSAGLRLGAAPTGLSEATLLSALRSFERAEALGDVDAIALNNRGNVYNSLLRWTEAAALYDRAVAAAVKTEYASVPSENRALVAVQLGDLADAQRRTEALVRRDPNFLDGKALLAAVKFARGDKDGAEATFALLCRPAVSAPNQFKAPIQGIGGPDFCDLYSNADFVRDRWTPAAVAAYDAFLGNRNRNARIAANTRLRDQG